jgi:tetratricopeptide (TPR) repeat protein
LARQAITMHSDSFNELEEVATSSRAQFVLARAAILTGHPDQAIEGFQKTLASSKDPRLLSWSHIYLGRMLDLDCKRDQAIAEYQQALKVRDGQQDTRLAAERGVKSAFAVKGHSCEDDSDDEPAAAPPKPQSNQPNSGMSSGDKPEAAWPNGTVNPK